MGSLDKLSSLNKRIITAIILIPFVISVLAVGNPLVDISLLLLGILLAWEWSNMVPSKDKNFYFGAYTFALSVLMFSPKIWGLVIVLLVAVFTYIKSKGEEKRCLLTLGVPYISVGVASLSWIYSDIGLLFFLWLMFVVWGMDTGGYVVGSTLKGPKLMPKVSPNKTISGLIGGLLFACLFGSLVVYYFDSRYEEVVLAFLTPKEYGFAIKGIYIVMGVLAMIFGFISQMGDLVESAIKRKVGVKDSSNLIPGHGGVFDRIDALIFVAPFVYVWFLM